MAVNITLVVTKDFREGDPQVQVSHKLASSQFVSAVSAYGDPLINVGGSIASGIIYDDLYRELYEGFPYIKVIDSSQIGYSAAVSVADVWESYVVSQIEEEVSVLESTATAYDSYIETDESLLGTP